MKFGPVTKLDKGNTSTSKKLDNNFMSEYCDVIVFFPIYGKSAAIRKPDSGRMVYKLIFSLIVIFYLTELENKTKKFLTQLLYYCFE